MSACIALRDDYDSLALRDLARRSRAPRQVRRLLALAAAYDGVSRTEAAKVGGMDRQTLRDWAHRFNDEGPDGLKHRSGAGRPRLLTQEQMSSLRRGNRPRSRGGRRGSLATYRPEAGHRRTLWCDLQRADPLRSAGGAVLLAHQRASAAPQTGGAGHRGVQKNFPRTLAAHIAALPKTKRVEIWFQDEARLGQKNGHARIWCARRTGRRLGVQVPRNEGVTKPRFSASRALAPARGQAKRRQRYGWAGLLSTEKAMVRGAEAFRSVEGNIAGIVLVRCRRTPRCQRTHARSHAFCWDPGRSSNCPGCRKGAA